MVTNTDTAIQILKALKKLGCREICLCPGGRNAPFVEVLSKINEFVVKTFFEERSAGFYALGAIKRLQQPVAIITTSGTAVAEVLPAVIEAHYSSLPLIVVSADRPKKFRGSGAPQAIEQSQIFSGFTSFSADLEQPPKGTDTLLFESPVSGPVHLNICFDEPLLPANFFEVKNYDSQFAGQQISPSKKASSSPKTSNKSVAEIKDFNRPLVILGPLDKSQHQKVKEVLVKLDAPIYAEAHSGFMKDKDLSHRLIQSGDKFVKKLWENQFFDSVVRIGGVPTLRLWRDLEKIPELKIINFSHQAFTGLSWLKKENLSLEDLPLLNELSYHHLEQSKIFQWDQKVKDNLKELYKKFPLSETNFIAQLSNKISEPAQLLIANSLPIREWDLVAEVTKTVNIISNRGANGIDGLLSTFFGACEKEKLNLCVLGDLSALYDLNAAWIYKQYLKNYKIKIVIINNGGGRIFSSLFKNTFFENEHDVNFKGWAEMFGLDYVLVKQPNQFSLDKLTNEVIELQPCNEQSQSFMSSYEKILERAFHEV